MFYDRIYRHNEALDPHALTTISAALHAVNAAVQDCQCAGKPADQDAATLLLIANLAQIAKRAAPAPADLRLRCAAEREHICAKPALLQLAGQNIGENEDAKRTFHHQARRALFALVSDLDLDRVASRVTTAYFHRDDAGETSLRHPDIAIRIVPRSFVPGHEITFNRCRAGQDHGAHFHAPIATALDLAAFRQRILETIGDINPPALRIAA